VEKGVDAEGGDSAQTVGAYVQKIIDAEIIELLASFNDLFGGDPLLVVIFEGPGAIHRARGFVKTVGGIFEARNAVGVCVCKVYILRRLLGIFVIAERNVIVCAVADAGIDQTIRLNGLDKVIQLQTLFL
jgi:hypothetical protein